MNFVVESHELPKIIYFFSYFIFKVCCRFKEIPENQEFTVKHLEMKWKNLKNATKEVNYSCQFLFFCETNPIKLHLYQSEPTFQISIQFYVTNMKNICKTLVINYLLAAKI